MKKKKKESKRNVKHRCIQKRIYDKEYIMIDTTVQTRWPVKSLKPGSPLFTYEGAEDQNFTISKTRAGLYWFEIKSVNPPGASLQNLTPSTVLLYATSSSLSHIPELYANEMENRHRSLRFQQRRSKRRLTISWNKRYR